MRGTFFSTLVELAREDERIHLVVGDLGFGVIEPFVDEFPDRFFNAGVAEQLMTGFAAGLALTGAVVFTYSIANFPTIRCLEQIRNDVCYHDADVKVVAVGGGVGYGALGFSHHGTQDVAVMRSLPGMLVASPGDSAETAAVTRTLARTPGPGFLRIGRAGEEPLHRSDIGDLPLGHAISIEDSGDVALLANGPILGEVILAAEALRRDGVGVRLASLPWVKPIDRRLVEEVAAACRLVVTIEEHAIDGGFGGSVAEILAELSATPPLLRLGFPADFMSAVGSPDYLRQCVGLDARGIHSAVASALARAA